ncbi:DUF1700 domain-containing protein [Streptococcus cameli]
MKREKYLIALASHLKGLSKSDYEDTMRYFTELFDDAGVEGEQDLMTSLGDPKTASADVMEDLLDKKVEEAQTHKEKLGVIWFALLAIAATPVGLMVLLPLLLLVATGILLVICFLLMLFSGVLVCLLLGGAFLWESLTHFQTTGILFFNIGGGLLSLGASFLLFILAIKASTLSGKGVVLLARHLYRKVKKNG